MDSLRKSFMNVRNRIYNSKKQFNLLLVGLDESGKTSMLFSLKDLPFESVVPTMWSSNETIEHGDAVFSVCDVTGRSRMRRFWHYFYKNNHGIVFVLDSSDRERFHEAKDELERILEEDLLKDLPVLILANKRDLEDSMRLTEITGRLNDLLEKYKDRCFIQASSAIQGIGLREGLDWMYKQLK